jgi:hypothetical protein
VLARLPKPVVIALAGLAALVALSTLWPALLGFLIGDGSGLGFLFRLGLLVAIIVGLRQLAGSVTANPTALASLRTAGVAVVKTLPPLARTISGGTRWLFQALKSTVIYLRGCRWPRALLWFLVTFGIFILQAIPDAGFFLMFLGAPFWSIFTINLGFVHLIIEPALRNISPRWSLVGLAWFGGYAAVSIHGHIALDRLAAEIAAENSRQSLPFDPRTQSLVVVNGNRYDAPSAERLLTAYPLSVVYEEYDNAGDAARSTSARDGRPRFTAVRFGPPELCDSIPNDARLKAIVTRYTKTGVGGFCLYTAIEAPDLPVVRLRFSQEKLRIIGTEGHVDRITLTSGGDERQDVSVKDVSAKDAAVKVSSLKAAPYQYLPLPYIGCYINGGGSRWECVSGFWKERQRAHPDNVALVGESLGLAPSSPASRSEQILAAGSAPLERAQNLGEAAAAAELDRLLAHPVGSTAQFTLNILSARPDLIAGRAERLAVAAAEALTTRDNGRNVQTWGDFMLALPDADFRQVGPSFVSAMLARWTEVSRSHYVFLGERLIYRLADLGATALPLLERIYQGDTRHDSLASIVALCRLGAPAADLTEKISASRFSNRFEMREAMILALMRQGRGDVADARRQQHEQWAAAARRDRGASVPGWSQPFEAKRRTMTPSSSPDACMITRN